MTPVLTLIRGVEEDSEFFYVGAKFIWGPDWIKPDGSYSRYYYIEKIDDEAVHWKYFNEGYSGEQGGRTLIGDWDDFAGFKHVREEYDYTPTQEGDRSDDL